MMFRRSLNEQLGDVSNPPHFCGTTGTTPGFFFGGFCDSASYWSLKLLVFVGEMSLDSQNWCFGNPFRLDTTNKKYDQIPSLKTMILVISSIGSIH